LLEGIDCVIHLAAISNDPSADLNPSLTTDINLDATVDLARVTRERGIKLLFSSSCSVYGEAEGEMDENSATGPLTTYAVSKLEAEKKLLEMTTDQWKPIILRNGTLFGFSPRMRFDLVINIFALYSCMAGEIHVFGGGMQWRPFMHVADCARAFLFLAENQELKHQVFNVSHENLRVADVAEKMKEMVPHLKVEYQPQLDPDSRDYRVVQHRLTEAGFTPRITVEMGVEQMIEAIITGQIRDPESVFYRNAKWLKELSAVEGREPQEVLNLLETLLGFRGR
jgi:nucleoside-diphosphate-sugar epimerase